MLAKGFTVIEVTVVLALVGMLCALGLFWTRELFDRESLESEQHTLVALITRARSYAFSNRTGVHSVCYDPLHHAYVTEQEERTRISRSIGVEGLPACAEGGLVFTNLAATATPVSITLSHQERRASVEVNREGYIEW